MYDYKQFIRHNAVNKKNTAAEIWRIGNSDFKRDTIELIGKYTHSWVDFDTLYTDVLLGACVLINPSTIKTWFARANSVRSTKLTYLTKLLDSIRQIKSDYRSYALAIILYMNAVVKYNVLLPYYATKFKIDKASIADYCKMNNTQYEDKLPTHAVEESLNCILFDFVLNDLCQAVGVQKTVTLLKSWGVTKQKCIALNFKPDVVSTVYT